MASGHARSVALARAGARLRRWLRDRGGEPDANLLVISDLHLGHDLRRLAPREGPPEIDRALGALLDQHAAPFEGLPWRLVIAGDMVDFLAVTLLPEAEDGFEVSEEEQLYGLRAEAAKAAWKLRRVLERHDFLLERLAAFVAAGNQILIIRGNHDADWYWPEVQDGFRRALAERMPPTAGTLADRLRGVDGVEAAVNERVRFCNWFYLEPGGIFIEHGNLHDEYSTYQDFLSPLDPADPRVLAEPISSMAMRYFGNRHASLDISVLERWGARDYLRWAVGTRVFTAALADYARLSGRLLAFSLRISARALGTSLRATRRVGLGLTAEDHRPRRLAEALRAFRRDHQEMARELSLLLRPPAEQSVLATAQLLYLDRIALFGVLVGTAASCAVSRRPLPVRAGILAGAVAAATVLNSVLHRRRLVDSHPKLLAAAHRVAVLFGVRWVVMGHSHVPVDQGVGAGARYFNLGTWLGVSPRGAPAARYLEVTRRGAELKKWSGAAAAEAAA